MNEQQSIIRSGKKYYHFRIKETRLGGMYLEIAENPATRSSTPPQRLFIFPEYATKFAIVLNRMVLNLEAQSHDATRLPLESPEFARRVML